jgi:CelD/BcsL family acetyltransferase involved in cellulose biosynthesis
MDITSATIRPGEGEQLPCTVPMPADWLDLATQGGAANPFYHPALLGAALAHLPEGAAVRVIEAREGDRLIGLLPVILRTHHGRYRLRNIANWSHDQCFLGEPLLRMGSEEAAWAGILAQLDRLDRRAHFLHLEGVVADSPAARALHSVCTAQRRPLRIIAAHDRALLHSDLSPEKYWQTHVRAKKRKEIRRLVNRLEELGTVTHRRLGRESTQANVSVWIDDFLAIERSGWKGREGTALDSSPQTRAFFRAALAQAHSANMLDMLRLDLDAAPLAMLVNFRLGSGAYSYKIAFDERYARYSPGILIEIDNLRAALSDPTLDWSDSCAAPNHPMIDGIWAERRRIVQFRVGLRGKGITGLRRRVLFGATGLAEDAVSRLRKGRM